ncbi:hypothetical protein GCM10022408_19660 [Hymenobacter fastidiosus]|uniref:TnsA endonuclease N-terminal domain-containing protein n=1 Tax=Hymenobacter fastidiosus TaxID=486264 RepID=A0ABP7S7G7_9BACT
MNNPPFRSDIVVYSPDRKPKLLVDVKVRPSKPVDEQHIEWPAEIRRQHGYFDCYFLLVTPERMLLFAPGDPELGTQIVGADSTAVLQRQLDTTRFPLRQLDEQQLVSAVYSWLMFSQFKTADELLADPAQQWLVTSGLHATIFHGDIQQEAA